MSPDESDSVTRDAQASDRLLSLLKHSFEVIALVDSKATIQFVSPAVFEVLGYTPDEFIGRNGLEQIHPDDLAEVNRQFQEVAHTPGCSQEIDARVRHKNGSWRWVESRVTNLLDNPSVKAIVSNFRDITDRKRIEQQLTDQQEYWRVALTSIGDAVILTDAQGRVSFLNSVAERLCGWSATESTGRPLREVFNIVNERTRLPVENPVEKVISTGQIIGLANHTVLIARDGCETAIDDSAAPIINDAGQISGIVLVFRDVQEKRRAEDLRQRLAAVIESSDDVILTKNLDGTITSWNKGAERVLGYKAEEVVGHHVSMLMPPDRMEDTEKILSQVRRGERVGHYETKRRRKDGKVIDVSLTVSPIRNEEGEVIGASKVGRDITDQRRVYELNERLAAIVESSDDIIVSKTLDGIITSWNKGAERVLGYRADEVIGKHVSMLMPPENLDDPERILSKIRRGERVDHYESRRRRKDGTIIDVSLTVSPIRDSSGNVIGASKIGRDITAQKVFEREREESNRRKDEFLAMLAHELRNPISAIHSAVQLFGMLDTERELVWAKDVIQRQVKHLARMIDDLLDVSRITRGKITLRKEVLNLAPVVASALENVRSLMEERKQELNVSLAPGELRLEADPVRLEQILINLLSNAAKFTDAGGKIWLTAGRENGDVVIRVRDNGAGISEDVLPRIFDLFAQGDRTIARSEGGLGIGLTIVEKLVVLHGGSVSAKSEGEGKGSEFSVRLPAVPETQDSSSESSVALPRIARATSRVLVVDDNLDAAAGLAKLLKLLGHDVQTAYDGTSAIKAALAFRPEVVLLDIGLPGVDGYEVARRLRADDCCRDALIIAATGYGQEDDMRKSKAAGFDHHLVKPIDFRALMNVMAQAG